MRSLQGVWDSCLAPHVTVMKSSHLSVLDEKRSGYLHSCSSVPSPDVKAVQL